MEHKAFKINKESVDKLFPKQDMNILGYQSPIEIVATQLRIEREKSLESEVFKAIQRLGITVHKDELIKALQYDRGQYEKGYKDGYNTNALVVALKVIDKFKSDIMHTFIDMCCGNDYNKVNLLQIGDTIDSIYDEYIAEILKKYGESENPDG